MPPTNSSTSSTGQPYPARKPLVLGLVADLGFEARDAGPLNRARLLEPYGMVWIEQTVLHGGPPDAAFGYMRKEPRT